MSAGNFDGTSFDGHTGGFDVDATVSTRHPGAETRHDPRIMRDDEEVMKMSALFITLIDP